MRTITEYNPHLDPISTVVVATLRHGHTPRGKERLP